MLFTLIFTILRAFPVFLKLSVSIVESVSLSYTGNIVRRIYQRSPQESERKSETLTLRRLVLEGLVSSFSPSTRYALNNHLCLLVVGACHDVIVVNKMKMTLTVNNLLDKILSTSLKFNKI